MPAKERGLAVLWMLSLNPVCHADADLKANFRHALVASEGKQQTGRSQDQCPDSFFHPGLVTQCSDIS